MKLKKTILALINSSLLKDTIIVTCWSVVGKGMGFIVPFLIAHLFGATAETDAFFFSYNIVLYLAIIFAPSAESLIVPFISKKIIYKEKLDEFVAEVVGTLFLILTILISALALLIKPFLRLVITFSTQQLSLVYTLLLETLLLVILISLSSIYAGVFNAAKKFFLPAFSPAIRAVVIICFIFMFKEKMGVHSICFGYLSGELIRIIILIVGLKKSKILKPQLKFRISSETKLFFKSLSFQFGGMVFLGLLPLINQTMVSYLGPKAISILSYAERVYMIPSTFLISGLVVVLLGRWSDIYNRKGKLALRMKVKKDSYLIFLGVLLMSLLLFFMVEPITNLIYGQSKLEAGELIIIEQTLKFYMLAFIVNILSQIFSKALVVLNKTKALMFCAFYMTILNLFCNYFLIRKMGVPAIALSTFIVYLFATIYSFSIFMKEEKNNGVL